MEYWGMGTALFCEKKDFGYPQVSFVNKVFEDLFLNIIYSFNSVTYSLIQSVQ